MSHSVRGTIAALAVTALLVPCGNGQESSSRPNAGGIAISGSTAALRDALSAACAQNETEFAKYLTARNGEAFARLTPNARTALMRRFVLLQDPGSAVVIVNAPGRPTVRCKTAAGGADLQIGGAEEQDNFALLPVEMREVTDETGVSVVRVKMGLIREDSQWKLMSVGLLLLDLPALETEWDAAETGSNEQAALDSIRKLAQAVEAYRRTYTRLPESLAALGPAAKGKATAEAAGLIDVNLAGGKKDGYLFRYAIVGASDLGAPAKFELSATPQAYRRTGLRSFFLEANGVLHAADHQGAVGNSADPRAE